MNGPQKFTPPSTVAAVLELYKKPTKVIVTAGMPYANGPPSFRASRGSPGSGRRDGALHACGGRRGQRFVRERKR